MALFTPDLYRQLGLGFVLGAVLVGAANADAWTDAFSPPAQAAQTIEAPVPDAEFLIAPEA